MELLPSSDLPEGEDGLTWTGDFSPKMGNWQSTPMLRDKTPRSANQEPTHRVMFTKSATVAVTENTRMFCGNQDASWY